MTKIKWLFTLIHEKNRWNELQKLRNSVKHEIQFNKFAWMNAQKLLWKKRDVVNEYLNVSIDSTVSSDRREKYFALGL